MCCSDMGDLPESKLAILAEGFVVERGKLAESGLHRDAQHMAPATVRPLAHTSGKWGLADK